MGGGQGVAGWRDQGGGQINGAGAGSGEGQVEVVLIVLEATTHSRLQRRLGGVELSKLRVQTSTTSRTWGTSRTSILGHDGRLVVRSRSVCRYDGRVVTGGRHHHPQLVQVTGTPGPRQSLRAPHHGGQTLCSDGMSMSHGELTVKCIKHL